MRGIKCGMYKKFRLFGKHFTFGPFLASPKSALELPKTNLNVELIIINSDFVTRFRVVFVVSHHRAHSNSEQAFFSPMPYSFFPTDS